MSSESERTLGAEYNRHRHRNAAPRAHTGCREDADCGQTVDRLAGSRRPTEAAMSRNRRHLLRSRLDYWSVFRSMEADDVMNSQLSSMIAGDRLQPHRADGEDPSWDGECLNCCSDCLSCYCRRGWTKQVVADFDSGETERTPDGFV